jgi:hypothetical protein
MGSVRVRRTEDRGSITPMVVALVVVSVSCAGLVLDGGRFIAERARLVSIAEEAARAGAQEVVGFRENAWSLDPAAAQTHAQRYLDEVGVPGSVVADSSGVRVTITGSIQAVLLGIFGVSGRTITVTRTALPVDQ